MERSGSPVKIIVVFLADVLVSTHIDDEHYLPPLSASSLLSPGPSLHNSPWHRVKYLVYVSVVTT